MTPSPTDDSTSDDRPTNRLGSESSAYLRQHRFNPVDWYPWGEEALARAKKDDKPILVSIGYSACHWCHVMERESFEDPVIAARMNQAFVNIKVDREERPDVDQIYMDTALKLNGQGGWPLNAICTPDGRPFYVGTYFPPVSRGGMPAFTDVIDALSNAWRERRAEIEENAGQIAEALVARPEGEAAGMPNAETVRGAAKSMMRGADPAHGGFGSGPKFPTPTNLEFLVASLDFLDPEDATQVARFLTQTAREMARRGLYDQVGGGFHRYCVDGSWTIPHFEKMLYDQGQLLSFYSELARRSHDAEDLLWPIRETIDYLRREMRADNAAFYASQDADSEGVEGKFFVWTPDQIADVLGDGADAFCTAYGVRAAGNFENGTTHLIDEARGTRSTFQAEREQLYAERSKRIAPATDPKHVTAWNAYTISGLARAASVTGDASMLEDASKAMNFLLAEMVDESGQLFRVHNAGRAHVRAFLDDHAGLLMACLDLQRAGAGNRYLEPALWVAREILERFADRTTGALYFTASDGDPLIHRPRSDHDGATPDASGLALLGLTRLAALSHSEEIDSFISAAIAEQGVYLERAAQAFPTLLRAVALRSRGLSVAVVVGDPEERATYLLAERARRVLRPDDAIVVVGPGETAPTGIAEDWLFGRTAVDGRPTAYVCRGTACSLPVHEPAELVAELSLEG
jgi:uncharacterized protein YyaL (SSP411 family)